MLPESHFLLKMIIIYHSAPENKAQCMKHVRWYFCSPPRIKAEGLHFSSISIVAFQIRCGGARSQHCTTVCNIEKCSTRNEGLPVFDWPVQRLARWGCTVSLFIFFFLAGQPCVCLFFCCFFGRAFCIGTPTVLQDWPHSNEWKAFVFHAALKSKSWPRRGRRACWMFGALQHQGSVCCRIVNGKSGSLCSVTLGAAAPSTPCLLLLSSCRVFTIPRRAVCNPFVCTHLELLWHLRWPKQHLLLKSWNIHEVPDSTIPWVACMWKQTSSLSHQTSKRGSKQAIL